MAFSAYTPQPFDGAGGVHQYGLSSTWAGGETAFSMKFIQSGGESFVSGVCRVNGASIGDIVKSGIVSPFTARFRQNENPSWVGLSSGAEFTWGMEFTTNIGTYEYGPYNGIVEAFEAPSKAINPTPADSATPGVDFSDYTLSWEDGGGADTFNIVAVDWDGFSGPIVTGLSDSTYTIPALSSFRPSNISAALQWRVDSINDYGTTTGDTWTFDPRPAKATGPSPADASIKQSIYTTTLSWVAAAQADTYKVYFENGLGDYLGETSDTEWVFTEHGDTVFSIIPLDYGTLQSWRVDSINEFGTTEGDTWQFTTLAWAPPWITMRLFEDGSVTTGPFDPLTMYITGENFMAGMRRLLAFCGDSLWYESVDQIDS